MYLGFFSRSIHDGNNLLAGTVYIQAQVKIEAYQLSNFPHHIIGNPKCDRARHHYSFFRSVLPPREDHFRAKVVLLRRIRWPAQLRQRRDLLASETCILQIVGPHYCIEPRICN